MKIKTSLSSKLIVLLTIGLLLFVPVSPVVAQEVPPPPTTPESSGAPEPNIAEPSDPPPPPAPTPPTVNDDPTEDSSASEQSDTTPQQTSDSGGETNSNETQSNSETDSSNSTDSGNQNADSTISPTLGQTTGSQDESHGDGDAIINTGDANSSAILTNNANSNLSGDGSGGAQDINVGNTGNGTNSTNTAEVDTNNSSDTLQTNTAEVTNDLNLASVSGDNDASYNTGVDSTIVTGDANTTATVINGVNTNIDGVAVVEFNVDDTHTGDIVLAFPTASGCTATVCGTNGNLTAGNVGNGSNSTNEASIDATNEDTTFQSNTADVTSDLVLIADSGHNDANYNTGGDSSITTGDANVVATVGNFVNNNLAGAGEVLIAVVNIFGDLIGNILLPESTIAGGSGTQAVNSGNGSGSSNTAVANTTNTSNTSQTNNATITNNLNVAANTGDNSVENNTAGFTNGDNVISSGDAAIDVNTINIANSNVLDGATWWLVFVNDASGNWVGQIMGAPTDANMAGSVGTEFVVAPDGTIIAKNTGNGSDTANTATVTTTNTSDTVQENTANVTNNLTLTANTGVNDTSYNTGGANNVKTGDANVMANLLNFVNNNFIGGKVVVSLVNVFGSWLGSFVPPGEEAPPVAQVGGATVNSNSNSPQSQSNGNSESTNSPSQNSVLTAGKTLGVVNEEKPSVGGFNFDRLDESGSTANLSNLTAGIVVEDNSISVPGQAKTAGAKTVIPSWIWKMLAGGIILIVLKRGFRTVKIRRQMRATI